jgi:colanic acid/amylovoran biosynthesis glycosyltransferase
MSLRIAYMTGEYPRATDTFIQREVAALRQRGVQVQTFSVRKPAPDENVGPEQQSEGENTSYLQPICPWDLVKSHFKLLKSSPSRYFAAAWLALRARPPGLKAMLWQGAYFAEAGLVAARMRDRELVHLHNHFSNSSCSVAMLASALGGFTYSFTMHGPQEFFAPEYWRIDQKIRRALFVCCISNFCRSQGMIYAPQEKWLRLHIVHCGVDPSLFQRARHEGQGKRLLFVGRLAAVKGLPVLFEAIAQLRQDRPNVILTIAGDGPDRQKLLQQAKELGIEENIRILGYQSQSQVRQLLGQSDVFVMSSFAEGVPVVLMEAMAAGVPVVATRVAGVPELVEDGVSGFLVPPGEASELAERIAALLDDEELRNRFGKAGRAEVQAEFNIHNEAQRLCTILTSALEGRVEAIRPEIQEQPQPAPPAPIPTPTPV